MQKRPNQDAKIVALNRLPDSYTIHWVAARKAQVVQAVRRGWLSLDEACARYRLSFEEYLDWQRAFSSDGPAGLTSAHLARRHRESHRRTVH
jgi:hypothetical protein